MDAEAQPPAILNPWTAIWWKPQAAINAVVQRAGRSYTLVLAALMGVATAIGVAALITDLHWFAVVAVAFVVGPFAGLLALYVDGALLSWIGRPLGGSASQSKLRTAIAWAALPNIAALLIMLGGIAVYHQAFLRANAAPGGIKDPVLMIVIVVLVALQLWGLFLKIRTVGAVQRFGAVRSAANVAAALLLPLAVALAFRTFLFQPFSIPASSMEPALRVGDYMFVDKRSYGWSRYSFPFDAGFEGRIGAAAPLRGDIIVFKLPSDLKIDYVKRVIGLPGDEVAMQHGVLHINGTPIPKLRVGDFTSNAQAGSDEVVPVFEETLPDGRKYTVLDIEPDGPFDNIEPVRVAPGHYFVLGDNRDNSMDSRSQRQVGFVPIENILGRVSLIYFSADAPRDTEFLASAFANIRWPRMFHTPQ